MQGVLDTAGSVAVALAIWLGLVRLYAWRYGGPLLLEESPRCLAAATLGFGALFALLAALDGTDVVAGFAAGLLVAAAVWMGEWVLFRGLPRLAARVRGGRRKPGDVSAE